MAGFLKKIKQRLSLIASLFLLGLIVVGCAGPTYQGWSGFASSDGILYFGGIDGKVYAISPTARSQNLTFPGQGEWVFDIPAVGVPGSICGPACAPASPRASLYATPVVVGDLVCIATYTSNSSGNTGKIIAINKLAPGYNKGNPQEEGNPQRSKGEWTYPSGAKTMGAIVGSPVVADDTLYVGSSDGWLYAIDTLYGESAWTSPVDTGSKIWTSPVVNGGVVYVSNYDRKLLAISSTDGTVIWQTELPASIATSPAVFDDSIFLGTFDNHLYAIDKTNGKEKWNFKGGNWFWSTPITKDGVVYAGCLDNKIYAIDASTGKELWQFATGGPIIAPPVLADGFIVLASKEGDIYFLDTSQGSLVRSINIGAPVMAPLLVENNVVFIHAGNFCIYCVDIQSGQKVWEYCYYSAE
jgi:outer membrane protein assembly factor BamB